MKKSSFAALMLGTVSGVLFALGMCMTLVSEMHAFKAGVIFGILGIVLGVITIIVWRKMEHKKPIKWKKRNVAIGVFGIIGALIFGVGMCFAMLWNNIVLGVIIGLIGILMILMLIPMIKGIK